MDKWTDWSKYYDSSHSTGHWKDYKKSYDRSTSAGRWIDYSKPSHSDTSHYDDSTRPITAFSSDRFNSHQQSQRHSHRSSSVQSRKFTLPPGHVALDLHGGWAEQWVANVKFALNHPDRMRAANEIPVEERPEATKSIDEEEFTKAVTELRSIDERIPAEIVEQATKLLFSTNLLPDYDLSTCYTMDLHSANMIALIMPLPDTSKFQMPPPFAWQQQELHLGIASWHHAFWRATDSLGRQDQTSELDSAQRPQTMRATNIWRILLGTAGCQQ